MTKPVLFKAAQTIEKRLENQEKATMILFYLSLTAIASAFIF